MANPTAKFVFSNPVHLLAFGFGSGLSPKAPGTVGTLAALPFWLYLDSLALIPQLAFLVIAFTVGVYICGKTSADLNVHDHGGIVWDEFVGVWLTLIFVPATWFSIVLAFIVFRFFDIVKPWPIRWIDKKVHGGFGIMIDDIIAGLFAGMSLFVLFRWI